MPCSPKNTKGNFHVVTDGTIWSSQVSTWQLKERIRIRMEPDADEVLEFEAEEEGARRLFNEHRHVKRA